MNREIKFRAWFDNGKAQDMFFVGDAYGTTHPLDCCRYAQDGQSVTLMQFTGLTDKLGVEIFEGDLLKMEDLIVPVTFEDGSFQIKTNGYQGASHLMQDRARRFVVCGNIYQNPELLNATKSK